MQFKTKMIPLVGAIAFAFAGAAFAQTVIKIVADNRIKRIDIYPRRTAIGITKKVELFVSTGRPLKEEIPRSAVLLSS